MKRRFTEFWSDESGATAIEYGLIAAGISLAIIAVVNLLGGTLNDRFRRHRARANKQDPPQLFLMNEQTNGRHGLHRFT